MSSQDAAGRTVAILAADGFEAQDLSAVRDTFESAGGAVMVVSPTAGPLGRIEASTGAGGEGRVPVDIPVASAVSSEFDGLVIPGGRRSADFLRHDLRTLELVRSFIDAGKPVAAVGAGSLVLKDANVIGGRRIAGSADLDSEISAANGHRVDDPVSSDSGVITARSSAEAVRLAELTMEALALSPLRVDRQGTRVEKSTIQGGMI